MDQSPEEEGDREREPEETLEVEALEDLVNHDFSECEEPQFENPTP
jgi:hypothetical protein